jgi:hypothetical protein
MIVYIGLPSTMDMIRRKRGPTNNRTWLIVDRRIAKEPE